MDKFRPGSGIIVGIASLLLSYAYYAHSRAYLEGAMLGTASSGLYTQAVAYCMALCGGILIVRTLLRERRGRREGKKAPLNYLRFILVILLAASYSWVLPYLGYIPSSVLAGCILLFMMTERNPVRLILFPAAYALIIYGLFAKALLISLPVPWFML